MPLRELPVVPVPEWLRAVSARTMRTEPFPLLEILRRSLYYPASGLDGDPIKYCGGNFTSFIYVDYGIARENARARARNPGLRGYRLVGIREVEKDELTPNGWIPIPPSPRDGNSCRAAGWIKPPYCDWYVFERLGSHGPDHGPERLSLLFLCADGAAAFQALFIPNRMAPEAIAIIQPGRGFGGNWTDFEDPDAILGRSVLRHNPGGIPKVLLFGGIGRRERYRMPCWPMYSKHLCWLNKSGGGTIGVWQLESEYRRASHPDDVVRKYLWRF